jgi:hypothetical protein
MKAYAVVWDTSKGLTWDNVDQIVETQDEAYSMTDISNDEEAKQNTPRYGFFKVTITKDS